MFETVLENHDFPGSGTGGGVPTWFMSMEWNARKSE